MSQLLSYWGIDSLSSRLGITTQVHDSARDPRYHGPQSGYGETLPSLNPGYAANGLMYTCTNSTRKERCKSVFKEMEGDISKETEITTVH